MPLLILGFFALQIDRANIGSALTSTITEDLGISTNEINVGNQLLSLGIFLLEIPSNMLLMRVSLLDLLRLCLRFATHNIRLALANGSPAK